MKGIRKPISKDSDVMVDAPTRKTLFEDCDWRKFMRYVKSNCQEDTLCCLSVRRCCFGLETRVIIKMADSKNLSFQGMVNMIN